MGVSPIVATRIIVDQFAGRSLCKSNRLVLKFPPTLQQAHKLDVDQGYETKNSIPLNV